MNDKLPKDMNVLIIDDEERICVLIQYFIEEAFPFNSVVFALNPQMALQKIQNQYFDLMIVDVVLSGKTGIDFIKQVKLFPKLSKVKFLLISGFLEQHHAQQAIEMGIKDILVKPFSRVQLISKVSSILKIEHEEAIEMINNAKGKLKS